MHKGKPYRRVLPPALYVNIRLSGPPPMRLVSGVAFRWNGVFIGNDALNSMTPKAVATLSQNRITWTLDWTSHLFDFRTEFFFFQLGHGPEYEWALQTRDQFGGHNLTRYRLIPGTGFEHGFIYFDLPLIAEENTGFFEQLIGWNIIPVRYPEEP